MSFVAWIRRHGWNLGVILSIILAAVAGVYYLGTLQGRLEAAHVRIDRLEGELDQLSERAHNQRSALDVAADNHLEALREARNNAIKEIEALILPSAEDAVVLDDGRLTSGYDMGVNSSGGRTEWVRIETGSICMHFPQGQQWGAVFITIGEPTHGFPRAARDYSVYRSLAIEIRGIDGGESVLVGLKDNTDPDDGSETKVLLSDLGTEWRTREISLAEFQSADLTRIYIPVEFVFEGSAMGVCVRRVEFLQ